MYMKRLFNKTCLLSFLLLFVFLGTKGQETFTQSNITYEITSQNWFTNDVTVTNIEGTATTVTIPRTVTSGRRTYSVTGIKSVGTRTNLTEITIPNSIISIENDAFRYCTGLTTITVNNSSNFVVNNNGLYTRTTSSSNPISLLAYPSSNSSTDIEIPSTVTSIKDYAGFSSNLTSIIYQGTSFPTASVATCFENIDKTK